jgi:Winged helix-turn helix/DDE superfamily endonuclease
MRLWTTQLVRHFLDTRFGIAYGRERIRRLLHELGCRLRRPRHRPLKATPEEQAAVRAALETRLAAWPEDWALLSVDEATVRRHPTLTAQWCLVGEVPEVPTGDDHPTVQVYGAVAPLTGRTHDPISPELGTGAFGPFLRHLLAHHPGQRLLVIQDRGARPKGAPVEAIARDAQGRLVLQAQPAYSPALNPHERSWTWWRRVVTHEHWFEPRKEPIEALRQFFRYLSGVKDQVRQLGGFNTPDSLVASL